jgi:hypothetical protein
MANDEQDIAEGLDEEVIDDGDDYSGEEVPEYPPERPLGVDKVDPVDPDDRAARVGEISSEGIDIIQLYDDDLSGEAVEITGLDLSAEEAAMHIIER